MKLIALASTILVLFIFTAAAETQPEVVVQAATPEPRATPAHTPPPPIKPASAEMVVQAAAAVSSQPAGTASPAPGGIKDTDSGPPLTSTGHLAAMIQTIDPDSVVPKDKVISLVRRIQEQQKQIEDNQAKIDLQVYNITNVVDQAFIFSRRASK